MSGLRAHLGVLARDLPRYAIALAGSGNGYIGIRNRDEQLEWAPDRSGVRCLWQWTSDLHAAAVWPWLGRKLLRRALSEHPIRLSDAAPDPDAPQLSFIIGHRGRERLPLLLASLRSIAAQEGAAVECLVVEQDAEPSLAAELPAWVRHVPAPPPDRSMPYCRSWAFNVGARVARGRVLVLHDNDMLVPVDYARNILERVDAGHDIVNPKRYLFYATPGSTQALCAGKIRPDAVQLEAVMQNAQGGGSIAITRAGFDAIGGMDEGFIGWGGEDNEFWERASTLRLWPFGGLPLVHLWHPAQAGKQDPLNDTARRYRERAAEPVAERIRRLRADERGNLSGPSSWPSSWPRTPAGPG